MDATLTPKDPRIEFSDQIVSAFCGGRNFVEAGSVHDVKNEFSILRLAPYTCLEYGWISIIGTTGHRFFKSPILIASRHIVNAFTVLDFNLGEHSSVKYWEHDPSDTYPFGAFGSRSRQSDVYFLQTVRGGPIKIGLTQSISKRIETLQTGCPFPLVCIGVIPNGSRDLEKSLHDQFAKDRLHGEWFEDSPELQSYISANAKQIRHHH